MSSRRSFLLTPEEVDLLRACIWNRDHKDFSDESIPVFDYLDSYLSELEIEYPEEDEEEDE